MADAWTKALAQIAAQREHIAKEQAWRQAKLRAVKRERELREIAELMR